MKWLLPFSFFSSFKSKTTILFLSLFFLFLLSTSAVIGIGISPPIVEADYQEGVKYEFDVRIINSARNTATVQMTSQGPYADYVQFTEDIFEFKQGELYHDIGVVVTLPPYNELTHFGKQRIVLRASEGASSSSGFFAVTTAVSGWFIVDIPVPGQYGVIDGLTITNSLQNQGTPIKLVLRNRGTQSLSGTSVKLSVFDYKQEFIESFFYDNINIPVEENYELVDTLPTSSYSSSKYSLLAEYTYDEDKVPQSIQKGFFIGSTDVSLLGYTQNLTSNKINKATFKLQSLWGSPLKNIRGVVEYGDLSQPLPVLDFEPFEEKNLDVFLDVPALNDTSISGNLVLTIPVDAQNEVTKEIPLSFMLVQEEVASSKELPLSGSSLITIALIIVVLLLVAVNIFMLRKRKK